MRRSQGELGEQIVPSRFLPVDVLQRIEVLDLARESRGVGPRVEESSLGRIPLHYYTAPFEDMRLKGQ